MAICKKSNFFVLPLIAATLTFQIGCTTRQATLTESEPVETSEVVESDPAIEESKNLSEQNRTEEYMTVAGTLKLVGTNLDGSIADNMAVYLNDELIFESSGNPPQLHALFREHSGDIAVIGMCANGGCLYRVVEITTDSAPIASEEFGFAQVERVPISHEAWNNPALIRLNDIEYELQIVR